MSICIMFRGYQAGAVMHVRLTAGPCHTLQHTNGDVLAPNVQLCYIKCNTRGVEERKWLDAVGTSEGPPILHTPTDKTQGLIYRALIHPESCVH